MKGLLKGKLVNLTAVDPEELGRSYSAWKRDSDLLRLFDSGPGVQYSAKKTKEWFEKLQKDADHNTWFSIRTAADDRLLGDIALEPADWNRREAVVGIGIGSREDWGKGYGTEAMQLVLEYAFLEAGFDCVSLTVFEYNPRAIRSYEKCGFRSDGRIRGRLLREGKRWDLIMMSLPRADWMIRNGYPVTDH